MSNNPIDWTQFYQQNPNNQVLSPSRTMSGPMFSDRVADATIVTTTITTSASVPNPMGSSNPSSSTAGHLSPEGRVAKPVRRRSRASRRTPTTLLNTDTTNFRAMVQQFTGGPSAPFVSGTQLLGATNFGFALGPRQGHHVNHPSAIMMPSGFPSLQYQQQQQHQQLIQQQSQPSSYMFSLSNNNLISTATTPPAPSHDVFLQRLGNPRTISLEGSDGFLSTEGTVSASMIAPPPPSRTPSSSNENRSNTFLFWEGHKEES